MVYQDLDRVLHSFSDPISYCTLSFNPSQMSQMLLEHSTLAPNLRSFAQAIPTEVFLL